MKINVSTIKREPGAYLSFDIYENMPEINVYSGQLRFTEPVNITGKASNLGETILVEGIIKAVYEAECTRCLKTYKDVIKLEFSQEFQASDKPLSDEIIPFTGDTLDITKTVKDAIILGAPMKLLCKPDCRGLCAKCGCDFNKTTCNCETESIDPRLSILKNLLK